MEVFYDDETCLQMGKWPWKIIEIHIYYYITFEVPFSLWSMWLTLNYWRRKSRWETFIMIKVKLKITKINRRKYSEHCKCWLRLDSPTVNREWQQIFQHYKGHPTKIQKMSSIYSNNTYRHIIMEHRKWNSIPLLIGVTHP